MTHPLEELAERVERAEGPDRELDAAIIAAIGKRKYPGDWWIGHKYIGRTHPAYTASLDAAMTLVPEGCSANVMMAKGTPSCAQVHHFLPGAMIPHKQSVASAATPALALVAASLRARAAVEEG